MAAALPSSLDFLLTPLCLRHAAPVSILTVWTPSSPQKALTPHWAAAAPFLPSSAPQCQPYRPGLLGPTSWLLDSDIFKASLWFAVNRGRELSGSRLMTCETRFKKTGFPLACSLSFTLRLPALRKPAAMLRGGLVERPA